MVGSMKLPVLSEDTDYLRKMRKPMIEKRRRDRMNKSIDQLKLLMADTIQESYSTKFDKADILDMTVSRLRQSKNHQASVAMASRASAYSNGFKDCARETIRYLVSTGVVDPDSLSRLSNHLLGVHDKKTGRLDTDRVSMTTEQQDPRNTASPPVTCTPPSHSTPVQGHSVTSLSTPLMGHSVISTSGSFDSSSSDVDSGVSHSDMDISMGSYVHNLTVPSDSFVKAVMTDSIIEDEKPWRPW